jgi:hypothetical protein
VLRPPRPSPAGDFRRPPLFPGRPPLHARGRRTLLFAARVGTQPGAEKAESAKKAEADVRAAEPAVPEGAAAAVVGGGGALPVAGAEALLAGPFPLCFHPTVLRRLLPHPLSSLELHSLELHSCLIPVNKCTSFSLSLSYPPAPDPATNPLAALFQPPRFMNGMGKVVMARKLLVS